MRKTDSTKLGRSSQWSPTALLGVGIPFLALGFASVFTDFPGLAFGVIGLVFVLYALSASRVDADSHREEWRAPLAPPRVSSLGWETWRKIHPLLSLLRLAGSCRRLWITGLEEATGESYSWSRVQWRLRRQQPTLLLPWIGLKAWAIPRGEGR